MADNSATSKITTGDKPIASTDPLLSSLIILNAAQLPLKLEPTTYTSWKAQLDALLYGYGLLGFIDGTRLCPPSRTVTDGTSTPNTDYLLWLR